MKLIQGYDEPREAFVKRVEAEGHRVIYPGDDELQIDIDSEEAFATFERSLKVYNENAKTPIAPECIDIRPSRSGLPKRHITVTMPFDVADNPVLRLMFQAIFGSDPVRELLSYFRVTKGDPCPTLFMEEK